MNKLKSALSDDFLPYGLAMVITVVIGVIAVIIAFGLIDFIFLSDMEQYTDRFTECVQTEDYTHDECIIIAKE